MTIHRPLGNAHPAYERAAEERAVRGLVFEIASISAGDGVTGELLAGWNDDAHAIVARYFGSEGCVGCGALWGAENGTTPARAVVILHTDICADCDASTYRDAFRDAIAERAS